MLAGPCHRRFALLALLASAALWLSGCAVFPDRRVEPQYHNPFPQLHRVAVLPFYNQSAEPTVDGEAIALTYYNALQDIPGFEVMPVGVAKQLMVASGIEPRMGSDFQKLARMMGVDAVLVGSVTEFSPYYPPRIGLAVDWYAANPSFHPIPAGYGLPWGRAEEEFIPGTLVQQAEFELARKQLATQTPELPIEQPDEPLASPVSQAATTAANGPALAGSGSQHGLSVAGEAPQLPADWPDPRGFVPPPPSPVRPAPREQHDPIITHTRIYHGQDAQVTELLENYYFFRDDARFGGWLGYLQRPDDYIRFCCHLHVSETLAARGGAGEGRVVWRWPIGRYDP
ncbi:MAG: hypothetical protein WD872_16840 [Pirellulaceae bacterium]